MVQEVDFRKDQTQTVSISRTSSWPAITHPVCSFVFFFISSSSLWFEKHLHGRVRRYVIYISFSLLNIVLIMHELLYFIDLDSNYKCQFRISNSQLLGCRLTSTNVRLKYLFICPNEASFIWKKTV